MGWRASCDWVAVSCSGVIIEPTISLQPSGPSELEGKAAILEKQSSQKTLTCSRPITFKGTAAKRDLELSFGVPEHRSSHFLAIDITQHEAARGAARGAPKPVVFIAACDARTSLRRAVSAASAAASHDKAFLRNLFVICSPCTVWCQTKIAILNCL